MLSILSKNQTHILSLLSKEKLIVQSFYLSGGTALAEFYLQLSRQFIKSEVLKDYPKMIQKIDEKEWQSFFMLEAKKLTESKLEL